MMVVGIGGRVLAAIRFLGWARSRNDRVTGAPSRKPAPRQDSRSPVGSLPPSRWTPKGISTAPSEAFAVRKMTVTGRSDLATGCARSTRAPAIRSRATALSTTVRSGCPPPDRDVMNMAPAASR